MNLIINTAAIILALLLACCEKKTESSFGEYRYCKHKPGIMVGHKTNTEFNGVITGCCSSTHYFVSYTLSNGEIKNEIFTESELVFKY